MKLVLDGVIFQKDPYGGIARIYREILPRMCEQEPGLAVYLFTDGPRRAALPEHPGIVERRLPAVRPILRLRGLWSQLFYPLRRVLGGSWNRLRHGWLADLSDGIWHSTYYTFPVDWSGPQVVLVHDMIHERYPELYRDALDEVGRQRKRRCIELADHVVCVSRATCELVKMWYAVPDARVSVVHPACSAIFRRFSESEGCFPGEPDKPYLLYVGGRTGYKNFSTLAEAYSQWQKQDAVQLVCVGAPWQAEELRLLTTLGLGGRVRLMQDLDDVRLCRLYNRALGFVHPSLEEGFGIPLLEAMACGCPIAASDIPSTHEVAGDISIYFDPKDRDSLRAALDRLARMDDIEARRTAGLERVKLFSWDKTARELLDIYRTVLRDRIAGN